MALNANIRALARLSLFAGFEPEALRLIAFAAQPLKFAAGDVVLRCGEPSDGAYLVLSGSLKLEGGQGAVDEGKIIGPGVLIGGRALLTPTQNSVSAVAQQDTAALKISRDLLGRVLEEFPSSAVNMKRAVTDELRLLGAELASARQEIWR